MRDAWQLLQIEPTGDARAIKAAYARLLRSTRPDDDAAAYQALREAYDRALAWAKRPTAELFPEQEMPEPLAASEAQSIAAASWEAERALESPADAPPEPDPPYWQARPLEPEPEPDSANTWTAQPEAPPLAPARSSAPPPLEDLGSSHATPDELVERARAAFCDGGYAALHEIWGSLEQGLDRLPLEAGAHASSAFASWVLDEPTLPSPLLLRLQERFHWSDDFRATAALPRALAHRLTTRITLARTLPDDEALRWNTELLRRLRLASGGRSALRLAWLDALAPRGWRAFRDPQFTETLAIAGANPSEQAALTRAARFGSGLRLSAGLAFAFVLGALLLGAGADATRHVLAGLLFGGACVGGYLAAQFMTRIMLGMVDRLSQGLPEKLREYRRSSLLADGCVTILALCAGVLATLPPTAPMARVMTGVLARLPEALAVLAAMLWLLAHRSEMSLGPPAFGFAMAVWAGPMRAENQPGAAGYMALIWLGAAGLMLEGLVLAQRHYGEPLRALRSNAMRLTLALVALAVPLLLALLLLAPALPSVLQRKHGPVAGYAPFCLPLALGSFVDKQPALVTLSLAAASLLLLGAQSLMTRAARRMVG